MIGFGRTLSICVAVAASSPAFADDVDECYKYLEADHAISYCTKIIDADSHKPMADIYSARGVAYSYSKQNYDRAIKDFNEAIRLNGKHSIAYGQRGIAYKNKGNAAQALADLQTAVALDPDNKTAANELKKLNDPSYSSDIDKCYQYLEADRAISFCTKIIEAGTYEQMSDIYSSRGVAYSYSKKNYDRAIKDFNEAIRLNGKNSIAYGQRGIAYRIKGNKTQALADLQTAVALDPDNKTAADELKRLRD